MKDQRRKGKWEGKKIHREKPGPAPPPIASFSIFPTSCAASLFCAPSGIHLITHPLLSFVWLCSGLQIPTEDDQLEVKKHFFSHTPPSCTPPHPRQGLNRWGFLSEWNGDLVKSLRVEAGGVTWGKPPAEEKLGWLQGEEERVAGSSAGRRAGLAPSPPESRLPAHSAVLFLIMIYSTTAVAENSLGRWLILRGHSVWAALECSLNILTQAPLDAFTQVGR